MRDIFIKSVVMYTCCMTASHGIASEKQDVNPKPLVRLEKISGANDAQNKLDYDRDSILVKFRNNATRSQRMELLKSLGADYDDVNRNGADDNYESFSGGNIALLRLNNLNLGSIENTIEHVKKSPLIEHAEPNYILRAFDNYNQSDVTSFKGKQITTQPELIPDDVNFFMQWGLYNDGGFKGVDGVDIDAPRAWYITEEPNQNDTQRVVVGVIDSGVNYNLSDMSDNIWQNPSEEPNGIDDDGNGVIDDIHGYDAINDSGDPFSYDPHGNTISSIIAAKGNNRYRFAGVAWDASLATCKAFERDSALLSDIIKCINYFATLKNQGVKIKAVNASWGGAERSTMLEDAIKGLELADILFVAAAGNEGQNIDINPVYPASYSSPRNLLTVSGSDYYDNHVDIFNYGEESVDMVAPSVYITGEQGEGSTGIAYGTSFAAPFVTGAAALAWSVNENISARDMKGLIMDSGDKLRYLTPQSVSGKRLNLYHLVKDALNFKNEARFSLSSNSIQIRQGKSGQIEVTARNKDITDTPNSPMGAISKQRSAAPGFIRPVSYEISVEPIEGFTFELSSISIEADQAIDVIIGVDDSVEPGIYSVNIDMKNNDELIFTKELMVEVQTPLSDMTYRYSTWVPAVFKPNEAGKATLNIEDDVVIKNLNLRYEATGETSLYKSKIVLVSPSNTEYMVWNGSDCLEEGYSCPETIFANIDLAEFNGEGAKGIWRLEAEAEVGLGATILEFALIIDTGSEQNSFKAKFSYERGEDGLSFGFTDESDVSEELTYNTFWDFGDGGTSTISNPTYLYFQPGEYPVSLTITDEAGNTSTQTQSVLAWPNIGAPTIDYHIDGKTLNAVGNVSAGYNYLIESWRWNFGDGNIGEGEVVTHEYSKPGIYNLTLEVTDTIGFTYGSDPVQIEIVDNKPPVADFVHFDFYLFHVFVSRSYDPDGQIVKKVWRFNDGTIVRNRNYVIYPGFGRANRVKLKVVDNDGLKDKKTKRFRRRGN